MKIAIGYRTFLVLTEKNKKKIMNPTALSTYYLTQIARYFPESINKTYRISSMKNPDNIILQGIECL